MNRRDFLNRLSLGTAVAALPAAAITTVQFTKEAADAGRQEVSKRLKSVEHRLDQMDKNHKRTMKLVLGVAGLSVGMDLTLLL